MGEQGDDARRGDLRRRARPAPGRGRRGARSTSPAPGAGPSWRSSPWRRPVGVDRRAARRRLARRAARHRPPHLHSHISRLRRAPRRRAATGWCATGPATASTSDPASLDVAEAHRVAADPGRDAATRSAAAVALWRGDALAEFADVAPLAAEHRARPSCAGTSPTPGSGPARRRGRLDAARRRPGGRRHPRRGRRAAAGGHPRPAGPRARRRRPPGRRAARRPRVPAPPGRRHRPRPRSRRSPTPSRRPPAGALPPRRPTTPAAPRAGRRRPASPLVGREHELALLRRRAATERLVTVVGPGGVGKTRLALEAAADLADAGRPVVLVELAAVDRRSPRHRRRRRRTRPARRRRRRS